jgi:hypothetical protein
MNLKAIKSTSTIDDTKKESKEEQKKKGKEKET